MLFTGLHHAREPLSYMMNIYLMTHLIYQTLRDESSANKIMNQSVLWFIPALNLDGYRKIVEIFNQTNKLNENIRKNRRPVSFCREYLMISYLILNRFFYVLEAIWELTSIEIMIMSSDMIMMVHLHRLVQKIFAENQVFYKYLNINM